MRIDAHSGLALYVVVLSLSRVVWQTESHPTKDGNMTRFMVTTVIENLHTGDVSGSVDVPEHLSDNWTLDAIAEWAIERDDTVTGMAFHYDDTLEPVPFGENGASTAYYYRVGARHLLTASVIVLERRYVVNYDDGEQGIYGDETMAAIAADIGDGVLDIMEVVA